MNEHIMDMKRSPKSKKKNSTPETLFHPPRQTQQPIEYVDQKPILLEEPIPSLKEAVAVELGQLDQQIETMTSATDRTEPTRGGKIFACKVCGKTGSKNHIRNHIEARHITGVFYFLQFLWKCSQDKRCSEDTPENSSSKGKAPRNTQICQSLCLGQKS